MDTGYEQLGLIACHADALAVRLLRSIIQRFATGISRISAHAKLGAESANASALESDEGWYCALRTSRASRAGFM